MEISGKRIFVRVVLFPFEERAAVSRDRCEKNCGMCVVILQLFVGGA